MNTNLEFFIQLENDKDNQYRFIEFNQIMTACTQAKDSRDLRIRMQRIEPVYFKYGFGGSHMWVKQIGQNDRILCTTFV